MNKKVWSLWGIGSINFKEWIIIWTLTLTLPTNVFIMEKLVYASNLTLTKKKAIVMLNHSKVP